jgi:hypothetical protein
MRAGSRFFFYLKETLATIVVVAYLFPRALLTNKKLKMMQPTKIHFAVVNGILITQLSVHFSWIVFVQWSVDSMVMAVKMSRQ